MDGRWNGRDSIDELSAFNLYVYNQNNPMQKIDILGNYDLVCNEEHLKWYRDISVVFSYNNAVDSITLCDKEMASDIIKEIVKDWSIDTAKEIFKKSELYKELKQNYDTALQLIKKGAKYVSLLGKSIAVSHRICLKNFELKVEGSFCCKKQGCYHFEKFTSSGETGSSAAYLATPNGPRILKNHLDELPKLFDDVVQNLVNQVKTGCVN